MTELANWKINDPRTAMYTAVTELLFTLGCNISDQEMIETVIRFLTLLKAQEGISQTDCIDWAVVAAYEWTAHHGQSQEAYLNSLQPMVITLPVAQAQEAA